MDETVLLLMEESDTCRYIMDTSSYLNCYINCMWFGILTLQLMLSSCRVFSLTVMSSIADFMFSMKNLVLDKLKEFSIILHYKLAHVSCKIV